MEEEQDIEVNVKGNKEKVLFYSVRTAFVANLASGQRKNGSRWKNRAAEVLADVGDESAADPSAGSETAAKAESVSYEAELERRIRELLRNVDGVGEADVMVVLKSSEERVWHVDKSSTSSVTEESGADSGSSRIIREEDQSESTVLDGKTQSPVMEKEVKPNSQGSSSARAGGSAVIRRRSRSHMRRSSGFRKQDQGDEARKGNPEKKFSGAGSGCGTFGCPNECMVPKNRSVFCRLHILGVNHRMEVKESMKEGFYDETDLQKESDHYHDTGSHDRGGGIPELLVEEGSGGAEVYEAGMMDISDSDISGGESGEERSG